MNINGNDATQALLKSGVFSIRGIGKASQAKAATPITSALH